MLVSISNVYNFIECLTISDLMEVLSSVASYLINGHFVFFYKNTHQVFYL